MRRFLVGFIFTFSSTTFAELSQETESAILKQHSQLQMARSSLMNRTREFNAQEASLQKLLNLKQPEFESALDSLSVSSSERQELTELYKAKDFKRFSAYSRKKLVQIYSRLAFDRQSWDAQFSEDTSLFKAIERHHQQVSEESYKKAQAASKSLGISLSVLKQNVQSVQKFCCELPKGGILHTHPYGTMNRTTVRKVLEIFNPRIDRQMVEKYIEGSTERIHPREAQFLKASFYQSPRSFLEIQKTLPQDAENIIDFFFVPRDTTLFTQGVTPFARFLAAFSLPLEMLGILNGNTDNQIALERIIYDDMFLRSLEQNVTYMEITRNLPVIKNSRQFLDRYNELLHWTEGVTAIHPRTLLSFNRTTLDSDEKRVQHVSTMTQLLSMKPSPYVVGINLMGDEGLVSALDASQLIYGKLLVENESRTTGLQATIHAGELGDVKNVRDALAFGVRRIGHGIQFLKNPVYLELARREGVALELNLTSNEVLQVSTIAKNPFLYFHRLGIPVSLSTDDEGMFLTDPNQECVFAILQTDIEYVELKQMMLNSLQTAFADKAIQLELEQKLQKDLERFEHSWQNISP